MGICVRRCGSIKNLIIIIGELASGKTTYGKMISNTLKIPFFSKDEIKEILYDSLNRDNLNYEDKRKIGRNVPKYMMRLWKKL